MNVKEIDIRYSNLAESNCCLSCGGALIYARPVSGEICLDLGSGRGNDVIRMAEQVGNDGFAYGLDISEGMLQKARKVAQRLDVHNVKFLKSELEVIPLDDDHLDLTISNCTINHADNKQVVWNEIFRILKSGGRFVVSDIFSTEDVPDKYRNDPVAVAECWAGAVTKKVYFETLNKAGFKDLEILEESTPYPKGGIEVSSFTIKGIKP